MISFAAIFTECDFAIYSGRDGSRVGGMKTNETNQRVGPLDYLPAGQPVRVNSRRGEIVETLNCRDQHGAPINAFSVKLDERFVPTFGSRGKWVKLEKPELKTVNYSFITVL